MAYREARAVILQRLNGTAIEGRKMILVFSYILYFLLDLMYSVPLPSPSRTRLSKVLRYSE